MLAAAGLHTEVAWWGPSSSRGRRWPAFHIVFAAIGIGMPGLMAVAEGLHLRTGAAVYLDLARCWANGTATLFAVGAVSGTVLSFELVHAFLLRHDRTNVFHRRALAIALAVAGTIEPQRWSRAPPRAACSRAGTYGMQRSPRHPPPPSCRRQGVVPCPHALRNGPPEARIRSLAAPRRRKPPVACAAAPHETCSAADSGVPAA
jgi:bd-type cytochrome oxidase subunit I